MSNIEKLELYNKAIRKYDKTSQMDMVIEECSELIQAISKFKRKNNQENFNNLCEEIADVEIMCEQAKNILNLDDSFIEAIKENKLERLRGLLLTSQTVK